MTRTIRDTIRVTIEMRAPKKGEAGYWVDGDATDDAALTEVIKERDVYGTGSNGTGFGWIAVEDASERDPTDGTRSVTVIAEWVSTDL